MVKGWLKRGKVRRDGGFAEVGVAAAGALLVLGAVLGNGVAATVLDMSDGQTWLPDDDGRVVQINPATGEPERRLIVGEDGSQMAVSQRDGHLIVTDQTTGKITAIDLSGLIASGSRGTEVETWVLIGGGQVILVEPAQGVVRAVDPLTLADIGSPYRSDTLAHAVIDDAGSVWTLSREGALTQLDFTAAGGAFVVTYERPVAGAGADSRLVPHERGVTVLAPDGGAIVQVGTGSEVAVNVPNLQGQVAPAQRSPHDLVPGSATDVGRVFMLSDGEILDIDVGGLGCERPDAPAVLAERVYVPCLGTGRVIVLGGDGNRAGDDIVVPGGQDPTLVVDEGRLFVHNEEDGRVVVVQPDGSSHVVDVRAAGVPELSADRPDPQRPSAGGGGSAGEGQVDPPPVPPSASDPVTAEPPQSQQPVPPTPPNQQPVPPSQPPAPPTSPTVPPASPNPDPGDGNPGDDDGPGGGEDDAPGGGDDPGDGGGGDDPGNGGDDPGDGGGGDDPGNGGDDPGDGGGGDDPGDGGGGGDPGDGGDDGDPPVPSGPTDVSAVVQSNGQVLVTWTAAETEALDHIVTASDGSLGQLVAGDATSATLTLDTCGTSVTITVTARFDAATQASGSTTVQAPDCASDPGTPVPDPVPDPDPDPDPVPDPDPDPDPAPPTNVQAVMQGEDLIQVTWTAPQAEVLDYSVTSSDGSPAQTVPGSATSAVVGVSTCGTTVSLTVTARFAGGVLHSASDSVQVPDCAPDPDPDPDPAPPTNVQAVMQGEDLIQVTWTAPQAEVLDYSVTSSDGSPAQTVPGSATSAVVGVSTCGTTVSLTVTARFAGGVLLGAGDSVQVPDCAPDPVEATAVTNVNAQYIGGGQVRVTWDAASSGADTYLVRPSGAAATDAGQATSVVLNLAPGAYTFTVETQLGGTQATSSPSGSVTVPGVPSAPGSVSGSATNSITSVTVTVNWTAAQGNGSPVTSYTVSHSGPGDPIQVTGTSTTFTIACAGQQLCLDGGALNVQVSATNAEGTGPAAGGTVTIPAADIPRDGDAVLVTGTEVDNWDGYISAWINYQPNATWASFSGTCTISVNEGPPQTISCSSPTTIWSGTARIYQEVSGYATVTITGGGLTATSSAWVHEGPYGWCDPQSGICYEPTSVPHDAAEAPGTTAPTVVAPGARDDQPRRSSRRRP